VLFGGVDFLDFGLVLTCATKKITLPSNALRATASKAGFFFLSDDIE
jgi:hypothetical protein